MQIQGCKSWNSDFLNDDILTLLNILFIVYKEQNSIIF